MKTPSLAAEVLPSKGGGLVAHDLLAGASLLQRRAVVESAIV